MRLAHTHPAWGLGFADEVWWSRLAQPEQHRWSEEGTIPRLYTLTCAKEEAAPKALACYGLLVRSSPQQADQMLLWFVEGRPVSAVTMAFLAWCSERLATQGLTALFLLWDNASWHKSQAVRPWLRRHTQQVKATGHGVRLVACRLPVKSPWLNPIEPKWVHGTRAVSEPTRLLSADELEARVYAYYGCEGEMHLSMPQKVA
jgi:DDE superfamily endonuclease